MRKVELYGPLGEAFGKEFNLHIKTVQQALKLLSANFKNFKQHLIDSDGVIGYEVWDGDYNLDEKAQDFTKQGTGTIKIIPVISGAGANGRIILGVVLVIVGVFTTWFGDYSGSVVMAGVGLIAGGIAEKLAPKPRGVEATDEQEATKSYIFSGAVNTTRQGVPVQIGYGKMLIGSAVISASITTVDIPV